MRKWLVAIVFALCFFLWVDAGFKDIEEHPYAESILSLYERGIVQGYPGNLYKSDQVLTRAELLTIIMKAGNIELAPLQQGCFVDVSWAEWFAEVVCNAQAMGIVQGYPDGTFKPYQEVSLVEALKIALLAFQVELPEVGYQPWYLPYLEYVHQAAIFSKYAIYPESPITRGMMAHLAVQLLEIQAKPSFQPSFASKGCSRSQPSSLPDRIVVDGLERKFLLQLGSDYRQDRPAQLIFGFHGRRSDYLSVAGYYDLDSVAHNAIFVYPLGLPEEGPERNWRSPGDKVARLRDYQLFDALVELVSDQYCIDLDQIYVVGHSLWGWFTSMLGCARGAQIRGVGIVAGSPMRFPRCWAPTAAMIFHNPADHLASYVWGEQIRSAILKQNQCWPETREYPTTNGMECVEYISCLPGAPVVFCKYFEGRHDWPQDVPKMMFSFFDRQ